MNRTPPYQKPIKRLTVNSRTTTRRTVLTGNDVTSHLTRQQLCQQSAHNTLIICSTL